MPLLGAHESVTGGLHLAFDHIRKVGGAALQIFTRNQRQWKPKPVSAEEQKLFAAAWQEDPSMPVASHASYLINLASGKEELVEKSIAAFTDELHRCALLRIPLVIIHPGSHGGDGVDEGLARFSKNLDQALELADNQVTVLLETTAGQGTGLGSRFEELAAILNSSKYRQKLGVCIDTCHIFAAGYDIRSEASYQATMTEFDTLIGIEQIKCFHLNDSKKSLQCRVDRHEHIGQGAIGLSGFANLLNDPRFANHPMILETPKGKDLHEDRDNLQTLKNLLKS
ncbi:MAG: deoxyribonuclease IV [Proteobacteria bacterium]|nr:deoxyribonuclease IV [Pseudomonadota bacterium]MBU1058951.1 deoxyribonuclease IV [Pseudomonadota bacterium]